MVAKSKQELINEDNKDKRTKRNNLIFFLATLATICYLANNPECLKMFLDFLKDIFSKNQVYWGIIILLIFTNIIVIILYVQKRNLLLQLETILNTAIENNKMLIQIEQYIKNQKR